MPSVFDQFDAPAAPSAVPAPAPAAGAPTVPAVPAAVPAPAAATAPAAPGNVFDQFDGAFDQFDEEQPSFAQNVGKLVKAGAGAVAGAVSEASPKIRESIIQGASRIPDIRLEDVKQALLSSLRDVDQATLNVPSEFLDMVKGLGRVPDATLQGLIDVWNAAGQFDRNLNPKDPSLQVGFSPTKLADKVFPKPETPSGKAMTVAGEFALGGKGVGAYAKRATRLVKEAPEKKLIKRVVKDIKRADNAPDVINRYLGLEDLSKAPDFKHRFPNMAEHGVTTGEQATKAAGKMYDALPNTKGFQSHLDVTKVNPRTGKTYGDLIERYMLSTIPELLPPRLLKKIRPGAGPFTVADKYLATEALRLVARTTKNEKSKVLIRKYIRAMRDLDLVPGQADDASKLLKKADGLYAEGMSAKEIGGVASGATKKGSAYIENLMSGKETVKAIEVLKGMDKFGDAQLEKVLGPNWRVVRAALRRLGDTKIGSHNIGLIGKFIAGFQDWRMIGWLTGGGVVGTAPYHIAKALKAGAK